MGDGHAGRGGGEVCVTAIETGLEGRMGLTLRDDLPARIRAQTPTHGITLATRASLDRCAEDATPDMIALVVGRTGLTREQALMPCSPAADLGIMQSVNREKGLHMMLAEAPIGEG